MKKIIILLLFLNGIAYSQDTTWVKKALAFNPTNYNEGRDIITMSDGSGFVVTGYSYHSGSGHENIGVLKVSASGETLWGDVFVAVGGDSRGYGLCESYDGNILITGRAKNAGGAYDYFILKVKSTNGDSLWMITAGGASKEECRGIVEDPYDSSIVICGESQTFNGGANGDLFIARYDSSGVVMWDTAYAPSTVGDSVDGLDHYQTVIVASDSNYVCAGFTKSTQFNGGFHSGNNYDTRGIVTKIDRTDGSIIWSVPVYNLEIYTECYGLIENCEGHYVVSGGEILTEATDAVHFTGYIMCLDSSDGSTRWKTYAPRISRSDYFFHVVQMRNGRDYFCIGTANIYDYSKRNFADGLVGLFDSTGDYVYSKIYGDKGESGEQFIGLDIIDRSHAVITGVWGKDGANYTTDNGLYFVMKFEPAYKRIFYFNR